MQLILSELAMHEQLYGSLRSLAIFNAVSSVEKVLQGGLSDSGSCIIKTVLEYLVRNNDN